MNPNPYASSISRDKLKTFELDFLKRVFICLSKTVKINSRSATIYIQSLIVETFIQCCSSLGKRKFRTDSRLTHDVHVHPRSLLQMRRKRRLPVTTLQQPVLRSPIKFWNLAHMFVSTPYFHRGQKSAPRNRTN